VSQQAQALTPGAHDLLQGDRRLGEMILQKILEDRAWQPAARAAITLASHSRAGESLQRLDAVIFLPEERQGG